MYSTIIEVNLQVESFSYLFPRHSGFIRRIYLGAEPKIDSRVFCMAALDFAIQMFLCCLAFPVCGACRVSAFASIAPLCSATRCAGPSSTCRAFFCLPDFSQLEWYVKQKDVDLADRRKFPANLNGLISPRMGDLADRRNLPANFKAPKSPWMGDLAACRIAKRFCNPSENPWRDFRKAERRPKNLKIP